MQAYHATVTAYNYADNSPAFTDEVAPGSRDKNHFYKFVKEKKTGKLIPKLEKVTYRADFGHNDFAHPSSMAISPEYVGKHPIGSLVYVEGLGWFKIEDQTAAGLTGTPRFDAWTALATAAEVNAVGGKKRNVTVFGPGETVPSEFQSKTAGAEWQFDLWSSADRLAAMPQHITVFNAAHPARAKEWRGLYVEGALFPVGFALPGNRP